MIQAPTPQVQPIDEIPAGFASLTVERVHGQSSITSVRARSPMKLLTPVSRGESVWACSSSFGGGLVAGDQTQLEVRLGADTRCHLGSQASTKVYRNPKNRPCGHVTRAYLSRGALLSFTPEPVQAFASARFVQRQEFELTDDASLIFVDCITSGRAACGERWAFNHLSSRLQIRCDGRIAFIDALRLDPTEGPLDAPHRLGRYNCLALLVIMGSSLKEPVTRLLETAATQPVERRARLIRSASPLDNGAVFRIAAEQVEDVTRELRSLLQFVPPLLGDDPWKRKW